MSFIAAAQRAAARILGAVVGAGAAVFGAKQLKEKRESAAVLALYQTLARHPDLTSLTAEEVKAIGNKFDVNIATTAATEVKSVYATFVENEIPIKAPLT